MDSSVPVIQMIQMSQSSQSMVEERCESEGPAFSRFSDIDQQAAIKWPPLKPFQALNCRRLCSLELRRVKANWKAGLFQVFDPGSMSLEQIRRFEICSHHQRQRGPLARCRLVGRRYGGLAYLP